MDVVKILKIIGLKKKYVCKSPDFYFWDESEFKNYTTIKYKKSEIKEMDEFYRIHESNLLHKKTGIRIKMSTSENYTGDGKNAHIDHPVALQTDHPKLLFFLRV